MNNSKNNNFKLIILLIRISKNINNNNKFYRNNNIKNYEKSTILALKIKNKYIDFKSYNEIIIK